MMAVDAVPYPRTDEPLPITTPHKDWHRRLTAALWLAEQGFAIVPIPAPNADLTDCTCSSRSDTRKAGGPCVAPGKHPRGGAWQQHATRDPDIIRGHLRAEVDQYGVFPLPGSGLLVIDCDDPTATAVQVEWPDSLGDLGTLHSSGKPKWHRFYRLPPGYPEADVPRTFDGGEVRVSGSGQVVGPWSQTIAGPQRVPVGPRAIAEIPAQILGVLASSKRRQHDERNAARSPADPGWLIHHPGRHDYLKDRARWLRGNGLTGDRLRDELRRLRDERTCDGSDGCDGEQPTAAAIDSIVAWVMRHIDDDPPPIHILFDSPGADVAPADPDPWPDPPAAAAYHGVAGAIAQAIAPHTEADPVALLATILTTFGALAGDARTLYQGSQQRANLFTVLVGDTGVGRKGTAGSVAAEVFAVADPGWDSIIVPGLGSGEGLVGHLKRAQEEKGSGEYRALVREHEFGRLLRVMGREGSTLSPILRDGWDGQALGRVLARDSAIVHRHHVAVIGHVTGVELRDKLSDVDAANGFGNRFLFLAVRRSRLVPFPRFPREALAPHVEDLHRAIREAQAPAELAFTPDAADRWEALYAELPLRRPQGLVGALTARAEAQIARLSLVYALLDRSPAIELDHLSAAEALWDYSARSARYIFGESSGNRHADFVLRLLRREGELDRERVKSETGLRLGADLDAVERALTDAGLAVVASIPRPGGGRPRRVLRLANGANGANGHASAQADGEESAT